MNILGINSVYHESAAALLVDGKLVGAVEEERLNRIKHGKTSDYNNPHISCFFAQTGVPPLVNTSFNDGEPIVCTPNDAIVTFRKSGIDALVMDNVILKAQN